MAKNQAASAAGELTPFACALRHARRQSGYSQLDLALEAGVSGRHLAFLETGRSKPSGAMVARLADALGLERARREHLFLAAGLLPEADLSGFLKVERARLALTAMDAVTTLYDAPRAEQGAVAIRFFSSLGVINHAAATIWLENERIVMEGLPAGDPPSAWLARYSEQAYLQDDPVVRWNLSGSGILHSRMIEEATQQGRSRQMMEEAGELGIRACVVLPAHRYGQRVQSFCGWTRDVEVADVGTLAAIRMVASAWMDLVIAENPSMSPRLDYS